MQLLVAVQSQIINKWTMRMAQHLKIRRLLNQKSIL